MFGKLDLTPWQAAVFISRWIVGILFAMTGTWKVFTLTPKQHALQYFLARYHDSWIPDWLLWSLGTSIPFLELVGGIMLCIGWRLRETATVLGGLLIVTTYGHALAEPLFDIDGHTFTRLALLLFVLLAPVEANRFSVDSWLARSGQRNP